MLSTSSSIFSTTGKHLVGQHVQDLQHLSTACTNPIRIGRMTIIRTPDIKTAPITQSRDTYVGYEKSRDFSYSYPTTDVTMAPIKEMPKVTHVCLYETLILQFKFEVDSLFSAAGPNVQVPKHGVSTSAGQLKQALAAFLKPRVAHRTQQACK